MKVNYKMKRTIANQLIIVISLSIALIGITSFSGYYIYSVKKNENLFLKTINKKSDIIAHASLEHVWNVDYNNVKRVLKILYNDIDVVSVKIDLPDFKYEPPLKKGDEKYFITIQKDIIADTNLTGSVEEKLGSLIVIYTKESIVGSNKDIFTIISLIIFFIIVIIAILLKITLNKFLKKPFDIFIDGFKKIAEGDYDYAISMMKKKDIVIDFYPLLKSLSKIPSFLFTK